MIDFTNCPVNRFRAYGGANGNKINITYQGHSYMLKFPPKPSRNRDMSYSNGCISEYVACHIFEMLGFRTQETLLGNYTDSRGKTKLVVACRDFTEGGKRLIEFAHLKNTCIDSEQNGYGKELSSILEAIEEQSIYPAGELRQFFWDILENARTAGICGTDRGVYDPGPFSCFSFVGGKSVRFSVIPPGQASTAHHPLPGRTHCGRY